MGCGDGTAVHMYALEKHGGCGEKYGSCVRENDGRQDIRAMVRKEDTRNPRSYSNPLPG